MDNSGQLTFSDDPLLDGINSVNISIQEGRFNDAVERVSELLDVDPEYPGLIEAYRTAKFWNNRINELNALPEGRKTADFLMAQWNEFDEYAEEKGMRTSSAYRSAMMHIFYRAAEQYRFAFMKEENPSVNFDLLLNLGDCFLRLGEYQKTVETLEYASRSYNSNARLLAILGEATFHTGDIPKSLWYFREAFFLEPTEIDLDQIKAIPVSELVSAVKEEQKDAPDIREWIPVYGFLKDIFYVRRNIQERQVENIKEDIYSLEVNFQQMNRDQISESSVVPRLITRYLWLYDYYEFQQYDFDKLSQIRDRLLNLDKDLFEGYFKKQRRR